MGNFCRIIELENNEQVLIVKGFDDTEEMFQLIISTDFDGATATMKLSFSNDKKMERAFNEYSKQGAEEFRKSSSEFFE